MLCYFTVRWYVMVLFISSLYFIFFHYGVSYGVRYGVRYGICYVCNGVFYGICHCECYYVCYGIGRKDVECQSAVGIAY